MKIEIDYKTILDRKSKLVEIKEAMPNLISKKITFIKLFFSFHFD